MHPLSEEQFGLFTKGSSLIFLQMESDHSSTPTLKSQDIMFLTRKLFHACKVSNGESRENFSRLVFWVGRESRRKKSFDYVQLRFFSLPYSEKKEKAAKLSKMTQLSLTSTFFDALPKSFSEALFFSAEMSMSYMIDAKTSCCRMILSAIWKKAQSHCSHYSLG